MNGEIKTPLLIVNETGDRDMVKMGRVDWVV